ncbi:hypothetical protein PQ478_09310 [Alkalihalophilus pseudofirmus]|uniref:hypothetical protein n=1 Tax=Alkalihalophilus pseudofirmus TaxID=79885 RepID=UPI00259B42C6|nr:hypothetical protein [Alkalihalophilus pseudofirmus]WEG18667.1 hypothetical protein PQ478_09310 [Alkalihalophilus pseudofirmus]
MKRYYVDPKHLIKHFTEIEGEDILLETYEAVQYGTGTDDVVATYKNNNQHIISKKDKEKCVEVVMPSTVDIEAMKMGYQQMGKINLELAKEGLHIENEAERVTEDLLK